MENSKHSRLHDVDKLDGCASIVIIQIVTYVINVTKIQRTIRPKLSLRRPLDNRLPHPKLLVKYLD